jgi:hypothetical protein
MVRPNSPGRRSPASCFLLFAPFLPVLLFCCPILLTAQTPDLQNILERLDRLERENRELAREVQDLRGQLVAVRGNASGGAGSTSTSAAAAVADLNEKVEIQGARIEEQAQTKVEASQKFPIQIAGMALFNSFLNSRQNGGSEYPTAAGGTGPERAGATLSQTIIGLEFHGPQTFLGGTVRGSVYMDFYNPEQWIRLRTGSIELDWKTRSILVGIEKPIFNPREPASLAQVGVSPLTGAGNLWLWVPQVRLEQDFNFTSATGVRAQMGVIQTHELGPYDSTTYNGPAPAASRPGLEGRYELFHKFDDVRRIELAPGFHISTTHVGAFSVPSSLFSTDWFFNPVQPVELTGAFFTGQNVSLLGAGVINEGYVAYGRNAYAIQSNGGWGQVTIHAARRVDVHAFTGIQTYTNSHLGLGDADRNVMFGVNIFFRLAPNVLLGPEISQLRTAYIGHGLRINNHYDLALAYIF